MNKTQKIGFAIMAAAVLLPVVLNEISYQMNMRKKISEIDAETQRELSAIKIASAIVTKKVQDGAYAGKSTAEIESDFYFYQMMFRLRQG